MNPIASIDQCSSVDLFVISDVNNSQHIYGVIREILNTWQITQTVQKLLVLSKLLDLAGIKINITEEITGALPYIYVYKDGSNREHYTIHWYTWCLACVNVTKMSDFFGGWNARYRHSRTHTHTHPCVRLWIVNVRAHRLHGDIDDFDDANDGGIAGEAMNRRRSSLNRGRCRWRWLRQQQ